MLITQTVHITNFDIAAALAGMVGYRHGSDLSLTFGDAYRYGNIRGSGLSFDSASQTWSGTVTHIDFYDNIWDTGLNVQKISTITFATPLVVSALTASLTVDFFAQIMNGALNTNTGTGGWGKDVFIGTDRPDSLNGGDGNDVVDYRFASQAVTVDLSGALPLSGAAAGDVLTAIEGVRGTSQNDILRGNAGANLLDGAGGDDLILATAHNDTVQGGTGWDRLDMGAVTADLSISGASAFAAGVVNTGFSGVESFVTGSGNDTLWGQAGNVEYVTNGGHDTIQLVSGGAKTVSAGSGNDLLNVFGADSITADLGDGQDVLAFVVSSGAAQTVTMTAPGVAALSGVFRGTVSGVEVIDSSALRLAYSGHDGRDEVRGSIGNDTLHGNHGDDVLSGGNGNDILFGDGDWGFQGGADAYGSDLLTGGQGDDLFHGARGWDSVAGGSGIDTLSYAQLFDDYGYGDYSITLNVNNTVSKIFTDWYGDSYVEIDSLTALADDQIEVIIGTWLGDTFRNNATARTFEGWGGADLYDLTTANAGDVLRGLGFGADVLRLGSLASATAVLGGNWVATSASLIDGALTIEAAGFDVSLLAIAGGQGATLRNSLALDGALMVGTRWADRFESASALDTMSGGEGDDTYVCLFDAPGTIIDTGSSLGDHLIAVQSVVLGASVEHVTLAGSAAANATGNGAANRMIGNDGANVLTGMGGADTLQGGLGSDTYVFTGLETLIEAAYAAPYYDQALGWIVDPYRDRVISSVSFTMTDTGFEDLTLAAGALDGTGNLQHNGLTGNGAANALRGLAGDDTLAGLAGADLLAGGVGDDRLRGDLGADTLRGDAGADVLLGGDGGDILAGGAGENRLTGGRGADQFQFGKLAEVTVIADFTDGVDKLAFAAATGRSETYILNHALQDGADVVILTTVAGMEIRVLDTTIAALVGDILIL